MSTIPGGCFVAPDSLRRLNQKQHARQAKLQQASGESQSPPLSPPLSPPAGAPSPSLAKFITNAPLRFSEMFSRARSASSPPSTPPPSTPPPSTPPLSPSISPRKLFPSYSLESQTPPPSPFLSPRKQSPLSKDAESAVETAETKTKLRSLSQSL